MATVACPECGAPLPAVSDAYCPECRSELPEREPLPAGAPNDAWRARALFVLKVLLILGTAGAICASLVAVPWFGELKHETTFLVRLRGQPLWNPPDSPPYTVFREAFGNESGFPSPDAAFEIGVRCEWLGFAFIAAVWLGSVALVCGGTYRIVRGPLRSAVLQVAFGAALGALSGFVGAFTLWFVFGPFALLLPLAGYVLGVALALVRTQRTSRSTPTKQL